MKTTLRAFVGGFFATLIFHQGVLALLHTLDPNVPAAFNMSTTVPLGVPAVFSLAFWGGVWGIPICWLVRSASGPAYWGKAVVFGAIGPSLLALAVVFPLKGMAFMAGWDPKIIVGALVLNGAWGLGLALFMRLTRTL
ncbi:MAG: hypothetical protein ACSHXK_00095 [Oceanococcus sp.]